MPILTPEQLRTLAPDRPVPVKPTLIPVVACTIAETDAGDRCYWCGWQSGPGHAKSLPDKKVG